jgi:hypothetical protein
MGIGVEATDRVLPTLGHEVCDKCDGRMRLNGWGYGFERWSAQA